MIDPSAPAASLALEPVAAPLDPLRVFRAGLFSHHIANTAYPIAHRKTIWHHRAQRDMHASLLRDAFASTDTFCLYAHIPFCERRCAFCEYTVVDDHQPELEEHYHAALLHELDLFTDKLSLRSRPLAGFDIGGGTPSLIAPARIGELVERVVSTFHLSPSFGMSIETTPKVAALHPERLAALRSFGIERISMGLQMVNLRLLEAYGRDLHKVGYNRLAADNIRRSGFERFNIDVMYGFARQTEDDLRLTLRATLELEPDIITLYRMRYKGTRIEDEAASIGFDRVVSLSSVAHDVLAAAGFIANRGKNTFSRHPAEPGTSAYLTERVVRSTPYLGLGLGAQTFTNNILAYNLGAASKRLEPYLHAVKKGALPIQDLYVLPPSEGMAKMVAVSMYFAEIDLPAFQSRFGQSLEQAFSVEVAFALEHDLMTYHGSKLRLTEAGVNNFPGVVSLFYSRAVKQHLIDLAEQPS